MSAGANDEYFVEDEHQVWLQIGSKLVPEYPITSVTEALYQFKKAVGHPFQMYSRLYRTHKYIIRLGLGKNSGAGMTGTSTKAGDLLTLNFRDCAGFANANVPSRVYCRLHYDCIEHQRPRCRNYGLFKAQIIFKSFSV